MNTPIEQYPELAEKLGVEAIYFKREDLHPYGSHKGRSIPYMIDFYVNKGDKQFVITGSGNAALAAALHIKKLNNSSIVPLSNSLIKLHIFIGNNIAPHKLEKIKNLTDDNIRVLIKERPLQALTQAVQEGARSLRQSTDDVALIGYETLAEELVEKLLGQLIEDKSDQKFKKTSLKTKEVSALTKSIGSVFIGTSSGTTAQALAQYFLKKKMPVQVHIVQTSSCHVMSDAFDNYDGPEERSIADAIVDHVAQRKSALVSLINKTGGYGWFATNENIETAQELVLKHAGLEISTNSALSVAGVMQAKYAGHELKGAVVCLICGE